MRIPESQIWVLPQRLGSGIAGAKYRRVAERLGLIGLRLVCCVAVSGCTEPCCVSDAGRNLVEAREGGTLVMWSMKIQGWCR
jgi:hypothetical protein